MLKLFVLVALSSIAMLAQDPVVMQLSSQLTAQKESQDKAMRFVRALVCCLGFLLLVVIVLLSVSLCVALQFRSDAFDTANQAILAGAATTALVSASGFHDGHSQAALLGAMIPLARLPVADWLNGDILRLDIAGFANKASSMLPYFHNAVIQLSKTGEFHGLNEDDIDNFFKNFSNWLDDVKQFKQVTDSDSKPVHGNVPSVVRSTLNSLFETALDPKQFQNLAKTCVSFTDHVTTLINMQGTPWLKDLQQPMSDARKVCQAVENVNPANLQAVLASSGDARIPTIV